MSKYMYEALHLKTPLDFCLLNKETLEATFKVASDIALVDSKLPYDPKEYEAFYKKSYFSISKEKGVHVTVFRMDWTGYSPSDQDDNSLLGFLSSWKFPIVSVFIPQSLFDSLNKNTHWVLRVKEERKVNFYHSKRRITQCCMFIASEVVCSLKDSELPRKAIDDFVTGN